MPQDYLGLTFAPMIPPQEQVRARTLNTISGLGPRGAEAPLGIGFDPVTGQYTFNFGNFIQPATGTSNGMPVPYGPGSMGEGSPQAGFLLDPGEAPTEQQKADYINALQTPDPTRMPITNAVRGAAGTALSAGNSISNALQSGVSGIASGLHNLTTPVADRSQTQPEPAPEPQFRLDYSALKGGQDGQPGIAGAAGGQPSATTIPLPASQLAYSPIPRSPDHVEPDYSTALETLRASAPPGANVEGIVENTPQMQTPERPSTEALDKRIEDLKENKPERLASDSEKKTNDLITILGAMAQGAAHSDGTVGGTIGAIGAAGARAWLHRVNVKQKMDKEFQKKVEKHKDKIAQAQMDLNQKIDRWKQAKAQVSFANQSAKYQSELKVRQMQQQAARAAAAYKRTIASTQMQIAQAHAKFANNEMDREWKQQVAEWKHKQQWQHKFDNVKIIKGNVVATSRGKDGVDVTQTSLAGTQFQRQLKNSLDQAKTLHTIGLDSTANKLMLRGMFNSGMAQHNLSLVTTTVARSLVDNAQFQSALGDKYSQLTDLVKQKLAQKGILPGTSKYQSAFNAAMVEEVIPNFNNPQWVHKMSQIDPLVASFAQLFLKDNNGSK